ncbi:hypothetical protein BV898_11855 [Hypsibius exemplaris]|uniref:Uncharacterized protein n=1 Tax=Hypsibius exemplaris TaxID=2072580 RepID=A0A1W0WFJ8_HYPEX|nr:hypothetical protein BV898_11855 [Hypsibius exemplaris]
MPAAQDDHRAASPAGRRYRIPPDSATEAQSENQRPNPNTAARSATCQKCGKRKPEPLPSHDFRMTSRSDNIDNRKYSTSSNTYNCPSNDGRKENLGNRPSGSGNHRDPVRQPSIIFDGIKAGPDQLIHCETHQSHSSCVHGKDRQQGFSGINPSSSGDLSDRDAVTRKIDKVLLPRSSPPPYHKRSKHNEGHQEDRQARERENHCVPSASLSPVAHREEETSGRTGRKEDGGGRGVRYSPPIPKSHNQNTSEPPRRNAPITLTNAANLLQNPSESAKLQPKDFSELGRRIWQNLFEATPTDHHYQASSNITLNGLGLHPTQADDMNAPQNYEHEEESAVPARVKGSVIPRHVRWQTQSPSRCSRSSLPKSFQPAAPTYQHVDGEQANNTDGKFIRMKFGKKVKMVQIPQCAVTDTVDDEVQVLVRHGKSVIWRNYKTFDHE